MNIASWNLLDWLLIAILIASMIRGFITGLIRTVVGLAGYFVGFEVASWGYVGLGTRMMERGWIHMESVTRLSAFVVILVLVVIVFDVLGILLQKKLKVIGASMVDRLLGAFVGFARGCFFGIGVLMISAAMVPQSIFVQQSVLRPSLGSLVHAVSFMIPEYVQERIL
jgi:membrane protein required for colicin V production